MRLKEILACQFKWHFIPDFCGVLPMRNYTMIGANIILTKGLHVVLKINEASATHPIIFFDGVCGLCNGFIDFIFKVDHEGYFKVATLQGQTAQKILDKKYIQDLWSSVLWVDGVVLTKSDAIFYILSRLGGIWYFLSYLKWIPRPIRDFVYDQIAMNRYKIFGVKETCRLPTPEERSRFLD